MLEENVGSPQGNEQQPQNFAHDNLQNIPAGQAAENFTQTKTTHREMDKKTKNIILIVCAVVLAAGIALVIILLASSSHDENGGLINNEEELSDISSLYEEIATDDNLEEITEGDLAIIEQGTSIPDIIEVYQKYIDSATSNERKIGLYNSRIAAIMAVDENKEYGEQVIDDAIEIDRIVHSISTAAQVCNIASYYSMEEIYKEYSDKIEKREKEQNIDTTMETVG